MDGVGRKYGGGNMEDLKAYQRDQMLGAAIIDELLASAK